MTEHATRAQSRLVAFYRGKSSAERAALYAKVVSQATEDQQKTIEKARQIQAAQ
jgi:hypothetical protein